MDPLTMAALGSTAAGVVGSLTQKKKSTTPELIDTRSPEQKAVSSKLAALLTTGAAPYTGDRVAGLTADQSYTQRYLRNALETAQPGIDRQLRGDFPEEFFNSAVADPTRRQFNDRVAPVIRENSELTGNRFADRSAIEMGQARGDVESSIAAERGKFGLETYRDPLNAATQLTSTLNNANAMFDVPRTLQQAKLDADFGEFMRTNPDAGGLIDAMLKFGQSNDYTAYVPQQTQSIYPSLISAGGSLAGASALAGAYGGSGTTAGTTAGGTVQRLSDKYNLQSIINGSNYATKEYY